MMSYTFDEIVASRGYLDFIPKNDNDSSLAELQIAYDIFFRVLDTPEFRVTTEKREIDQQIIVRLLEKLNSKDPQVREFLHSVLRRIYVKFVGLRSFIRKEMNNKFYRFLYETEFMDGIGELLDIVVEIIRGLRLPLKPEFKLFLEKIIIPMHKVKELPLYHTQLRLCITEYLDKYPLLTETVVLGLLKFWPKTSTEKEALFLDEIEDILAKTVQEEFKKIQVPLFRQIAKCVSSTSFPIAERALYLWGNSKITVLIVSNHEVIMPIMLPTLFRVTKDHWNRDVVAIVFTVLKMFLRINKRLFNTLSFEYKAEKAKEKKLKREHEERWNKKEKLPSKRFRSISEGGKPNSLKANIASQIK
ncbi:serine/threonine-protein phosphatase 2A 56 kDa regulatory subunit alpha isoform [Drosophila rhopaloa]|uniref:Serine/threonine-protein phosphatase 2A 56 kDa regulatory subunit alpha isoform n=1 Tax=Drosophila rhopaloa TaxID=1041015 RepID=A0A6P4E1X2_DRORH|nr:serine/threonine-protein phosphatase 2A 56 kDa regulatory subunit alpha isoform [Drosophila rhopaloa]